MTLRELKNQYDLTVYFDWCMRRGIMALYEDDTYEVYPSLNFLLDGLARSGERALLIGEATFESFNLAERLRIIDRCALEGHKLLTVPTRETTKARFRAGFGRKPSNQTETTDYEDACSIRHEVEKPRENKHGMHLKVPVVLARDDYRILERLRVNKRLMELRSIASLPGAGMVERPRKKGTYKFVPDQEVYVADLISRLPAFDLLAETQRKALGASDGKSYNPTAIVTVGVIAEIATSTRQFDRLAGLYAHAYGSQARSNLMFWVWAGGNKRQKLYAPSHKDTTPKNMGYRRDGLTLSEFRRELRWLYHQLKK